MVSPVVQSYLEGRSRSSRLSTLWHITKKDTTELFFTDHDTTLQFEGNTYTPVLGVDATARQRQVDMEHSNLDIVGVLDDATIDDEELAGGLWRGATIEEILVDFRAPWAGPARRDFYIVTETKRMAGESWSAKLQGLTRLLEPRVGNVYNRNCRHVLGDTLCAVALAGFERLGTVTSISTLGDSFRIFKAIGTFETPHGLDSEHWDAGVIDWDSGDNFLGGGLSRMEVKSAVRPALSDIVLTLQLDMSYPITIGDTFKITPGCDKTTDHCRNKYSNLIRFGGFPHVPGNDRMLSHSKA